MLKKQFSACFPACSCPGVPPPFPHRSVRSSPLSAVLPSPAVSAGFTGAAAGRYELKARPRAGESAAVSGEAPRIGTVRTAKGFAEASGSVIRFGKRVRAYVTNLQIIVLHCYRFPQEKQSGCRSFPKAVLRSLSAAFFNRRSAAGPGPSARAFRILRPHGPSPARQCLPPYRSPAPKISGVRHRRGVHAVFEPCRKSYPP